MGQARLPDLGVTNWRHTTCPACGGAVAWTVATPHSAVVRCTAEVGERGARSRCGFALKRAEWDYIREKGPEAGQHLKALVEGKRKERR